MSRLSRTHIAQGFVSLADVKGSRFAIRQLAALLLEYHLHAELEEIVADIEQEYFRRHGRVEAHVKTAFRLSQAIRQQLSTSIKKRLSANSVQLQEEIDRSLLGGVVITAPGMELDLSLRTKLAKLKV